MDNVPAPVAIVGMDCAFPAARDKDQLWSLLMNGGNGVRRAPSTRWTVGSAVDGGAGVDLGCFLDDIDMFDSDFFGIAPREAAAMDPQQRLLLQCSWRAMEDAGIGPHHLAGTRTGVYVGVMSNEWAFRMTDLAGISSQLGTGNGHSMLANRISYQFDLRGPSVSVDTACSSSLVAVQNACTALAMGECDTALVAGVNLILTPALGIFYGRAGLAAPDGVCKPFSRDADGIGRGEGAAVVMLRLLEDAVLAGDSIYAVIRGGAVNHGGRGNGVTAPNRWSQRDVIAEAYERARINPVDVRFVEAHGTGTLLGDMIEAAALGEVHAARRERPCLIGSIKGNLGHTEGVAGMAGLVKTALALRRRVLPPSPHSRHENPALRLADRGLRLVRTAQRLPAGEVIGAVSSFGLGGTNAHLVVSAPPAGLPGPRVGSRPQPRPRVFTLSAPDLTGLQRNLAEQAEFLGGRPTTEIAGISYASNRVKSKLRLRFAMIARSSRELVDGLNDDALVAELARRPAAGPRIGLLLRGEGAEFPGMTSAIYRSTPLYRRHLDEVDEAMRPHLGCSLLEVIFGGNGVDGNGVDGDGAGDGGNARVRLAGFARPATFGVGYALGATLLGLGVEQMCTVGQGVGELAAACLVGSVSLQDAAKLACRPGEAELAGLIGSRTFAQAAAEAMRSRPTHLVELGPRPGLGSLVGSAEPVSDVVTLSMCRGEDATDRDLPELIAELYRAGLDPVWDELYLPEERFPERLAPYRFSEARRFDSRVPVHTAHPAHPETLAAPADDMPKSVATPAADATDDPTARAAMAAIAEVGGYDIAEVTSDSLFYDDLGYDSIMIASLVRELEARLPQLGALSLDDTLPAVDRVADLLRFLNDRLADVSRSGSPAGVR